MSEVKVEYKNVPDIEVTEISWVDFIEAGGEPLEADDFKSTQPSDFEHSCYDDLRESDL